MITEKNKREKILEQAELIIQDCEDQIKELENIINYPDEKTENTYGQNEKK